MIELNKNQINALTSIIYDKLYKSYNERREAKRKELENSTEILDLYNSLSEIKAERKRLEAELAKLNKSGERLLRDAGFSSYFLNYEKKDFIRYCTDSKLSNLVKLPTKSEIKDQIIIQTIVNDGIDNLIDSIVNKFV